MSTARWVEVVFVVSLFAGYGALWRFKRIRQRRTTGRDPDVLASSPSPLQKYMARMFKVLTVYLAVVILGQACDLRLVWLEQIPALNAAWCDALGFGLGVAGLGLCALAQRTIGNSWRVGIDEDASTSLVTNGIYRYVRNPTYLGLYMINGGVLWIWPTPSVAIFVVAFVLLMEVQVRCEEEYLSRSHGEAFRQYVSRSWRYLPFVY